MPATSNIFSIFNLIVASKNKKIPSSLKLKYLNSQNYHNLIHGTENMCVILLKPSNSRQTRQCSMYLVSVQNSKISVSYR